MKRLVLGGQELASSMCIFIPHTMLITMSFIEARKCIATSTNGHWMDAYI
jgi:hypothetical protein